jgi:hypothetical protein
MLAQQSYAAACISAWPIRAWLCKHLHPTGSKIDGHQSEADRATKAVHTRVPVPPASSCGHSQPHFAGYVHAVHSLQEKLEVEAELHFHDRQPQWFAIAHRDSVAAVYLALHSKSCRLKEAFHNRVKRGLRHARNLRHRPASQQA